VFTFVVRSKRDADALRAMVQRFYSGWGVEVKTLHGARGAEAILKAVSSIVSSRGFYIILLGREDREAARVLEAELPPNAAAHVVPKARVRNARLEQLYVETLRARARLRLAASWGEDSYLLSWRGRRLEDYTVDLSFDNFIGLGSFARLVSMLTGSEVGENPLVLRLQGGLHYVYNGVRVRALLEVGDEGYRPRARIMEGEPVSVPLSRLVDANREVVEALAEASAGFLRSLGDFDRVVVPWSGGKDSTAALLLAIRVYGRRKVVAVYGDTGTEFPDTVHYVEEVASRLGVEFHRVYAGVDEALRRGAPMPNHSNRWCTGLKVRAIESKIKELVEGRTLVLIGDRDAESPARSDRPPARPGPGGSIAAAPLKPWSGAAVQLYVLSHGVPLNPMYSRGFYRVGCYMCPALRNWELYAMLHDRGLCIRLAGSPIYRRFIHSRLYRRRGEEGGGAENPG